MLGNIKGIFYFCQINIKKITYEEEYYPRSNRPFVWTHRLQSTSYDGGKSITLKADGTVECKNTKYNYDSWGVMEKNESQASCRLSRKGIDRPISVSVFMDTHEHSIVVDNETFRKAVKKKEK